MLSQVTSCILKFKNSNESIAYYSNSVLEMYIFIYAVNGAWTAWTGWSICTATCRGGVTTRVRQCANPAPAHGGLECDGLSSESKKCNHFIFCARRHYIRNVCTH